MNNELDENGRIGNMIVGYRSREIRNFLIMNFYNIDIVNRK